MKNIKLMYWIVTGLFSAFMLFSSVPDIIKSPDAIAFITALGYPEYFVVFIGVAKVLGILAILVPGFPRLKEWAYAGLFFDLFGAAYSITAQQGFQPGTLVLILPVGFLFWSYFLHHKKESLKEGV